jgi:hypothetical protein
MFQAKPSSDYLSVGITQERLPPLAGGGPGSRSQGSSKAVLPTLLHSVDGNERSYVLHQFKRNGRFTNNLATHGAPIRSGSWVIWGSGVWPFTSARRFSRNYMIT